MISADTLYTLEINFEETFAKETFFFDEQLKSYFQETFVK